ncbi:hypothetical protein BJV78DRAFT_1204694 [Lactifluus subvellereus]|nr:hypothetical protein BJV78DRAFT_1204694 [Lactifluus subvellereus]
MRQTRTGWRRRARWKRRTMRTLTLFLHASRSSSRVVERVHSPDSSTNQTPFAKPFCTRGPHYPLLLRLSLRVRASVNA